MQDLYKRVRPRKLSQVVGQDHVVKALRNLHKDGTLPHVILFSGPSGVGKTTLGRIVARMLGCNKTDYEEINAANDKGIGTIREIEQRMHLSPLAGDVRVWMLDEVHMLSSAAAACALKVLEDMPSHAYFILATTDPGKVAKAIRTRSTEFKLKSLPRNAVESILRTAGEVSPAVMEAILDASEGSARKALVLLHQVLGMEEADQLEAVLQEDSKGAIDLARQLITNASWHKVSATLKSVEGDPERVRYTVLAYCSSVLLGGGNKAARAYEVFDAFRFSFDESGKAGIIAACWECRK